MEIVVTVALLAPLGLLLLLALALAVTVHFFWLSHQGKWPPDLPGRPTGDVESRRPTRPRGRHESHA